MRTGCSSDLMRRPLVVEGEARALVADRMNAGDERVCRARRRACPAAIANPDRRPDGSRFARTRAGCRSASVPDAAVRDAVRSRRSERPRSRLLRGFDQLRHRGIDMRAISGRLGDARPRDQAALRPRVPRTGRHVIGVEQIGEALIERAIGRRKRPQQKLLEEPRDMRAMPLRRTGVRASIARPDLPAESGAARRSVSARTARKASSQCARECAGRLRNGGVVSG